MNKTQLTTEQKAKKFDEERSKRTKYNYRRMVWRELMIDKAEKANITVSETEVDQDVKRRLAERK